MVTYEIEQKYRVDSLARVRQTLKNFGVKKIMSGREWNEFYDRDRFLQKKKSIIRLRQFGKSKAFLTFKGPRLRSRFSKRVEMETPVCFQKARALLRLIGFRMVKRYTKTREEFKWKGCLITLDSVPSLGSFVEIEGSPRRITSLERKLGFKAKQRESKTYLELLFDLKL